MAFVGAESLTWKKLFSGFDSLHAITYSSGIGFVYQLIDLFEEAEIIFGCDEVLSYSLQEIMAYQCKMIERMRETATKMKIDMISRIDKGALRFYIAHTILSHEKLYLLASKDGHKRVIMGSANMSFSAFSGQQRENICYIDGDEAYDWYWDCYCQLRDSSTDQVSKDALLVADDDDHIIEELPIAGTVKAKKAIILQPVDEAKEEVRFVLDVKNLTQKFAAFSPKPDRKGKLILKPEMIKTMRKKVAEENVRQNELRSVYPELEIFVDEREVKLNGTLLDLSPEAEKIEKDAQLFLRYMDGYTKFHGNVSDMQWRYFEFANWFFCSPFMACMRDAAKRYDYNPLPYPVFGLIYGQSKAGKTSFLETLLKMMIGQKTKIPAPDFTRTSIEGLKRTVKGAPIIVDDLTNTRFNQHAIETIKNDDFGTADHLLNYPAVVMSANADVKAVAPEVIRRTIICRVEAGLTNTEVMRSNIVRTVQREIGTAFYREYLNRMLIIVPDLLDELKEGAVESAPDILAASSNVLVELLQEYSKEKLPFYVHTVTLEDYFSERVTSSYAIKNICEAWETSRSSFKVLEKVNELQYNAGAVWEADRLIKELPETLEAHKSREWVVMNLEEAKAFFGVPFKKTWLERLHKK